VGPDFIVLGHQKCGTTALYHMLKAHPQIFMPEVKEPRFFATDLRTRLPIRSEEARRLQTLEGYAALFTPAAPGQLRGEASPQYLRSHEAPAGIAALRPDARLIAIFREPASFLRSFHLQMVSSSQETELDFGKAIALEQQRREGKRLPRTCHNARTLLYSDHVRYGEQLQRLLSLFAREQLLVLVYDDFRADNEGTVRQVLRFLEVDEEVEVQAIETKPLKAVRSRELHQLAGARRRAQLSAPAAGRAVRALNAAIAAPLRSDRARAAWRRAVYKSPPEPDPQVMSELRRRSEPEVRALGEFLGRDLVALWGYDRLD
jgi:hypothetical protein